MQADKPKQYLHLAGKTILEHTLSVFAEVPFFKGMLLGVAQNDSWLSPLDLQAVFPRLAIYTGGRERAETVLNGLHQLAGSAHDDDWIWVHDAARPCVSHADISRLHDELQERSTGALLALPVTDTLKQAEQAGDKWRVMQTIDRRIVWRALTPQVFRYAELKAALSVALEQGLSITDECSAIELAGGSATLVEGSPDNIKVTMRSDLPLVELFLAGLKSSTELSAAHRSQPMLLPRIGSGFDVHAFTEGNFIILGGVKIPYERALLAHSDGDVLLHALMDAMLGALALGDIGKHFPDTDPKWKGADSRKLLRHIQGLIDSKGYIVGNLDATIIAQAPKMAPFIEQIQTNIAEDLAIDRDCVGIKATTTEKLGFTGRKEGIACQVTVLLIPRSDSHD